MSRTSKRKLYEKRVLYDLLDEILPPPGPIVPTAMLLIILLNLHNHYCMHFCNIQSTFRLFRSISDQEYHLKYYGLNFTAKNLFVTSSKIVNCK